MAKPKKYISSKLKVKRKFVLGGDTQQELYLNDNVTYQAQTPPTALLQNQFDAQERERAAQMAQIYGQNLANQLVITQDINKASEQRTKEEETARQQQAAANKQAVDQQVTQTAVKAGKQLSKDYKAGLFNTVTPVASNYYSPTWAPVTPAPVAPVGPAPVMINPAMQTATSTTGDLFANAPTVGQNLATTSTTSSFGQTAAAVGKSVGGAALVAAPAIVGQVAYNQLNKADDRQMKREKRSQYYDDTDYSRKEFNAQMLKSTGKGATIGGTIGSMIPIPGVGTGVGMAIGAGIGAGVGAIKATHQRRMTKDESERGVKVGNKRFGKKLLFGEENVYDENLDPTVIEKRNREAQLKAMTETANALDNATLSSMTQYDTNTGFNLKSTSGQMVKYGGKLEYLKGGVAKSLGRGAKEYVGKSHEEGGIDLPGNIEVEGGETEQNNYIFSKHLKLPTGISYAQAHKNLLKSGASSEEIKQLALSQEAAAGRNPNEIKTMKFAKYGGRLKYENGGPEPTINNANTKFAITAQKAGNLDYTERNKAGNEIWAGENYEKEWKPLVSTTMGDNANADKVIAYLENYSGQDAADVKAKLAGKTREQKIAAINKLATDKMVGPFHNAVLEGINSTQTPPPAAPPVENNKVYRGQDIPEVTVTGEKIPTLPNLPEYKDPNLGWTQAIPAIAALGTNIKPAEYAPALANQYVRPGAVGRVNIGRVSYNTERAANQGNLSAMNQALQNMSGPGAVAGMLAAKTKADQQNLAIANAEQNANIGLAAKETEMNTGISKFNVGAGMQAQTTNAGIAMQNAAMQNDARKFNAASRFQANIDNRDTKLSAGQQAIDSYLTYDMDKRKLAATERVARAQDYSGALYREEVFNKAKRASQDPNNKDFYGKSDAELWDYTRQYDTRMHGERGNVIYADAAKNNQDQKKFGGAKKYVSRLGDLKNVKYKV